MLIVTATSESSDHYVFKFDSSSVDRAEIQARVNACTKNLIGDYNYDEDYSYIHINEVYNLDNVPELMDYEPLYEKTECD